MIDHEGIPPLSTRDFGQISLVSVAGAFNDSGLLVVCMPTRGSRV